MYNERQREWTAEQLAEAAQDALDNWEWEVFEEGRDGRKAEVLAMTDIDYCRTSFADDDGIIRLEKAFKDVWEWIDERMESGYSSSLV